MKVSEQAAQSNEYLKDLDKKYQAKKLLKEAELEKINQISDKNIENAKAYGEERFNQHIKLNEDRLLNASKNYEDKLTFLKNNIEKVKKDIDKEENELSLNHTQTIENQKNINKTKVLDQYLKGKETEDNIQNQFRSNMLGLESDFRQQKNKLQEKSKEELTTLSTKLSDQISKEDLRYNIELESDSKIHNENLNLQKNNFKQSFQRTAENQNRIQQETSKANDNELSFLDKHLKNTINQKQNDFKIRYEKLVKENDEIIKELNSHFEADVQKVLSDNASKKQLISNKNEDQFYRIQTLSPKLIDNEKEIILVLPVAEHEKENLLVSVHDRNIYMTLSRKFSESFEDKDGSNNKSSRSELFTKEIASKDILNPKAISQKYENGILSIKIAKK